MAENLITRLVGNKRRWRQYRARVRELPPNYREAVEGIQRYLMYFGAADGDTANSLFEDVADLFERAAADGTRSARSWATTRSSSSMPSSATTVQEATSSASGSGSSAPSARLPTTDDPGVEPSDQACDVVAAACLRVRRYCWFAGFVFSNYMTVAGRGPQQRHTHR